MPATWTEGGIETFLDMLTTGNVGAFESLAVVLGTTEGLSGDEVTFSDLGLVANTGYAPQDFHTGNFTIDGSTDTITYRDATGVTFNFDPSAGDETIFVMGVAYLGGPGLLFYQNLDPPFVPNPAGDSLVVPLSVGADGLPLE